jgi:leader peptidase (prepilin peptidase)/N-methyltransferase
VPVLVAFVAMALLGVLLGAVDISVRRLPHVLVLPAIGVALLGFATIAMLTGQWDALLRALAGALVLGLIFFTLHLLAGAGLGFGDVTLAVLLGQFLGWLGWREVWLGALLPWLINGPVVLVLLLLGRVKRTTLLPFGPALLVGSLLAVLVGAGLNGAVRA